MKTSIHTQFINTYIHTYRQTCTLFTYNMYMYGYTLNGVQWLRNLLETHRIDKSHLIVLHMGNFQFRHQNYKRNFSNCLINKWVHLTEFSCQLIVCAFCFRLRTHSTVCNQTHLHIRGVFCGFCQQSIWHSFNGIQQMYIVHRALAKTWSLYYLTFKRYQCEWVTYKSCAFKLCSFHNFSFQTKNKRSIENKTKKKQQQQQINDESPSMSFGAR